MEQQWVLVGDGTQVICQDRNLVELEDAWNAFDGDYKSLTIEKRNVVYIVTEITQNYDVSLMEVFTTLAAAEKFRDAREAVNEDLRKRLSDMKPRLVLLHSSVVRTD
jgi:hypothetical protein